MCALLVLISLLAYLPIELMLPVQRRTAYRVLSSVIESNSRLSDGRRERWARLLLVLRPAIELTSSMVCLSVFPMPKVLPI